MTIAPVRWLVVCGLWLPSQGEAGAEPVRADKAVAADIAIHGGLASHPDDKLDLVDVLPRRRTDATLGLTVAVGIYVRPTIAAMFNLRVTLHPPSEHAYADGEIVQAFYASGFVGPGLRLAVTKRFTVQPALGLATTWEDGEYYSGSIGPAALVRAELTRGAFAFGVEAMSLFGFSADESGFRNEIALTAGFTR